MPSSSLFLPFVDNTFDDLSMTNNQNMVFVSSYGDPIDPCSIRKGQMDDVETFMLLPKRDDISYQKDQDIP
jgi:hypothetical protein